MLNDNANTVKKYYQYNTCISNEIINKKIQSEKSRLNLVHSYL